MANNILPFQPRPDPKALAEAERQAEVAAMAEQIMQAARRYLLVDNRDNRVTRP